jgi:hypothetical protein
LRSTPPACPKPTVSCPTSATSSAPSPCRAAQPLFRWNEKDGNKEAALKEWIKQGSPNLEPLLTGCAWQPLLPDAYHASCRNADRLSRPYSLKASVAFLQTMLGLMPADIRAVVGPCYDRRMEEYRVGLGPKDKDETYHGIVWPLLGAEDEATDAPAKSNPCCARPASRT